jgi:hypothetical protein
MSWQVGTSEHIKFICDFKEMHHRRLAWHPTDSEQLRSVPRTLPTFGRIVEGNGGTPLKQEGTS